jgi:hypothetical protein
LDCNMENEKYPTGTKEERMYEELMEELVFALGIVAGVAMNLFPQW